MSAQIAEQFITEQLAAVLPVPLNERIHAGIAPPDALLPLVYFNQMAADQASQTSGDVLLEGYLYQIVAVSATRWSEIDPIARLIYVTLHKQRYTATASGTILSCLRQEPYSLVSRVGGVPIYHRGGLYRIVTPGEE